VCSGAFLGGLRLAARVQAGARRRVEARTRALWHLLHLPAGTDVARLRCEVAALGRELHRMSATLERALADLEASEEVPDADDPRRPGNGRAVPARRAAGPRPPGRRAAS
jgi:hypothetical protein